MKNLLKFLAFPAALFSGVYINSFLLPAIPEVKAPAPIASEVVIPTHSFPVCNGFNRGLTVLFAPYENAPAWVCAKNADGAFLWVPVPVGTNYIR